MKVGGMFKSPMTIMMVASMVMIFFLPKMMANLDPEQLEVRGHKTPNCLVSLSILASFFFFSSRF